MSGGNQLTLSWQELGRRVLSVAAIRQVDRTAVEQFHMHPLVLMENAALQCAQWLQRHFTSPRRMTVLCGRGNNGGDGLAIARHMRLAGWDVRSVVLGPVDALSGDALANYRILTARGHARCLVRDSATGQSVLPDELSRGATESRGVDQQIATWIAEAEVLVDAMLGTGASGTPRAPLDQWIQCANAARGQRVAIDIPTGLDASTGQTAAIAFRAAHTLTFVALKPGFAAAEARALLGEVHAMPIGIPQELVEELLLQSESSAPGGGS